MSGFHPVSLKNVVMFSLCFSGYSGKQLCKRGFDVFQQFSVGWDLLLDIVLNEWCMS